MSEPRFNWKYKPNYGFIIRNAEVLPKRKMGLELFYSQPFASDAFNVMSLPKEEDEIAIIDQLNRALAILCEEYDWPLVQIPEENIYIITQAEFDEKFPEHTGSYGKTAWGMIYIVRNPDHNYFIWALAHFFAELIGYYFIDVTWNPALDEVKQLVLTRGFMVKSGPVAEYAAFDAAVAEMLALTLRKVRCLKIKNCPLEAVTKSQEYIFNPYHCGLMEELI